MLGYSATPNPTLFETRTLILLHKASERFKISDTDPDLFLQVSRMILQLGLIGLSRLRIQPNCLRYFRPRISKDSRCSSKRSHVI